MKFQFIILLFLLSAFPCMSQKREMISKSTIRLEGKNTNIRDYIEIDGYYLRIDPSLSNNTVMIFFEDGTCASMVWFKEGVSEDMKRENLSQAIYSWTKKGKIRWGSFWGVYKIDKDTLVQQTFVLGNFLGNGWTCEESKYEIIDKQTIKLIYNKSLFKMHEHWYIDRSPHDVSKKNFTERFILADSLPSSDCWLKEEKWIWRNESDWKDYMEKMKQKNKK